MKYRPSRRGDPRLSDTYSTPQGVDGCPTARDETCIAVRRQTRGARCFDRMPVATRQSAVCSVACLAWSWWIAYPPTVSRPGTPWELTVETMAAKEAKNRVACYGKHLGCSPRGRTSKSCGLRFGWISPRAATRRRRGGFPLKPVPGCHHLRYRIATESALQSSPCLVAEQPRCFPRQATRFLASFAAMVSTVNSRGVPGRETVGGYAIHHDHARQATLHTALWRVATGALPKLRAPRVCRRTAIQVSSRAVGHPSTPCEVL
jgi:hypothetical protein